MIHNGDDVVAAVRGLGSRREGMHHWLGQRISAVLLVGFVFWLLTIFPFILAHGRQAALAWLSQPWTAFFFALFLAALFYHLLRGLEVIIEDYVPGRSRRFSTLWIVRLGLSGLYVVDLFELLRLVFVR